MPKLTRPPRLRPGDLIGVVVPASPIKHERLEKGVRYLEHQGYRVKLGRHVFQQNGYLAGRDTQRADDINRMFRDREVSAIFCARGGYGSPRLLPLLDYRAIKANPKIFVGYSDITAMQLAMLRHSQLVTFTGPMVAADMAKDFDPFTEENFWRILADPQPFGDLLRPSGDDYELIHSGRMAGPLIGGCLSLVACMIGSSYFPNVNGSIFFVEEIGEAPYRIDRYLAQLREAGVLERIGGFLLGQMTDCVSTDDAPSLTLADLMRDFIRPLKIPAMAGLDYGHDKIKYTLPIGVRAELKVNRNQRRLTIVEPAVS